MPSPFLPPPVFCLCLCLPLTVAGVSAVVAEARLGERVGGLEEALTRRALVEPAALHAALTARGHRRGILLVGTGVEERPRHVRFVSLGCVTCHLSSARPSISMPTFAVCDVIVVVFMCMCRTCCWWRGGGWGARFSAG